MRYKSKLLTYSLLIIGLTSSNSFAMEAGEHTSLIHRDDRPQGYDCLDWLLYGTQRAGECLWAGAAALPKLVYRGMPWLANGIIQGVPAAGRCYRDACKQSPFDTIVWTGCTIIVPSAITGIFVFTFKIIPDWMKEANDTSNASLHNSKRSEINVVPWKSDTQVEASNNKIQKLVELLPEDAHFIQFSEGGQTSEFLAASSQNDEDIRRFARYWYVVVKNLKRNPLYESRMMMRFPDAFLFCYESRMMMRFPDAFLFCYAQADIEQQQCAKNIANLPLGYPAWQKETSRLMSEENYKDVDSLLSEISYRHPVKITLPLFSVTQ